MTVIGLDISLNGSAGVMLLPHWEPGAWASGLVTATFAPPKNVTGAERLMIVAAKIVGWVRAVKEPQVYIEDYAFAARVTSARAVAELVGCVKRDLWCESVEVKPIAMNTARKLLLGRVPTKKKSGIAVKDYVNHALSRMGAQFPTMDEGDAFVIANCGRSLLGLPFVGVGEEAA
jgi:Holliday junction resolvasome RuvABC endonuclease subunit